VLSENGAGNVGGVEVAAKAAEDGVGDGFFEGFNFCFYGFFCGVGFFFAFFEVCLFFF
jgi:hypothetical protein